MCKNPIQCKVSSMAIDVMGCQRRRRQFCLLSAVPYVAKEWIYSARYHRTETGAKIPLKQ